MKKIYLLGLGLTVSALNVNAMEMQHDAPFLGMNTKMNMCNFIAEDSFSHRGSGEIKLTMNKNYVLANCKAEYLQYDEAGEIIVDLDDATVERNNIPCRIVVENPDPTARPKMIHHDGIGGFTATPSGNVSGHCKASK